MNSARVGLLISLLLAGCAPRSASPDVGQPPPPPEADAYAGAAQTAPVVEPAPPVRATVDAAPFPPDTGLAPARPPAPVIAVTPGPDFAAVFARVSPSVVGVATSRAAKGAFKPHRTGTGFVWDGRGHVVTNAHIVADAQRVRVRTVDGLVLRARLVGRDADTDLAVLRVDAAGLYPVNVGDARALRPGEWVSAIGNPYGMHHSITVGVVSALGRRDLPPGAPKIADFIQTDLNINPGNSGGPLVDTRGRVVGLNTAVLGKGQGLAFAIPIDMVQVVVERLVAEGRFVRGFGGLFVKAVTRRAALEARLESVSGARVGGVVKGGPAATAGLLKGDIIVRFGEVDVEDAGELPWMIARTRPGTAVQLEVARGPERLVLTLQVSEAPE